MKTLIIFTLGAVLGWGAAAQSLNVRDFDEDVRPASRPMPWAGVPYDLIIPPMPDVKISLPGTRYASASQPERV